MCVPCALPWFAALLARLGLAYPLFPTGGVRYALAALAIYRLVMLVCTDDGPFDVFLRIRERAGVYDRGADGQPTRALGRLLACPYCVGMWWATVIGMLALWPSLIGDVLIVIYGLAGAQALIQDRIYGGRDA